MKGTETQQSVLAQNPSLWGCLMFICRYLPLSANRAASPSSTCGGQAMHCPYPLAPAFANRSRETMIVYIGRNSALQAASGIRHSFVCPRESELGPNCVCSWHPATDPQDRVLDCDVCSQCSAAWPWVSYFSEGLLPYMWNKGPSRLDVSQAGLWDISNRIWSWAGRKWTVEPLST